MDAIDTKLVERLQQEYMDRTTEMWRQNEDLGQRLRQARVAAVYDIANDRLELTLDAPQEALSYSIHNTLFIRADFDSLKIVGMELDHFTSHAAENSTEFRLCWNALRQARVEVIRLRGDWSEDLSISLGDIVKELVAAG